MCAINRTLELAKEKGISQAFICGKLGLRRTYLSDVRIGKDSLTDDRLIIIAAILNTTPEYLKGETDVKERKLTAITGDELKGWEQDFMHDVRQLNRDNLEMLWKMARTMAAAEKNSDSQEDV